MQSIPDVEIIVTHATVDMTWKGQIQVRLKENGFDTATVTLDDPKAVRYSAISSGDAIVIKQGQKGGTLTTIFSGKISHIDPITSIKGNIIKLECDGSAYGIAVMLCGQEYGTQSKNPTLDTIKEIIEDNTNGIIDLWVNKLLGTAVNSGYSYTTQVETIAGTIPYIYAPYKPCKAIINDLCDIVQAIKGTNAGVHWICDTSNRFILGTVGSHGAPASTYWTTYWNSTQDESTITEGHYCKVSLTQLPKEANYVLYYGRLIKPANGDLWTENSSGDWDSEAVGVGVNVNIADDNTASYFVINDYSLRLEGQNGGTSHFWYPAAEDAGWQFENIESPSNPPVINFYFRKNDLLTEGDTYIRLCTTDHDNDYFEANFCNWSNDPDFKWIHATLPIGNYWKTSDEANRYSIETKWTETGSPDWNDINCVSFKYFNDAGAAWTKLWIDGLNFQGAVLRGARQSDAYSSADPCIMKCIRDDQAKDDSLVASDDSGTLARLAYAEYLRCLTTPLVGTVDIPIEPKIKAGQLIHLHAKKTYTGYAINQDFRIQRVIHTVADKAITTLEVTSDIINSVSRPVPNRVNKLFDAVKPESQDRQSTAIKFGDIDITQPILEKSY